MEIIGRRQGLEVKITHRIRGQIDGSFTAEVTAIDADTYMVLARCEASAPSPEALESLAEGLKQAASALKRKMMEPPPNFRPPRSN